jgi:simple sugar transport system ATP-binding protein
MYRLELIDITKRYPGVIASDGVSLAVRPGEIHAVLGENGAGKSTLMKIIYGVLRPDAGELRWNGEPLAAHGPAAARARGIAMVFQHFSLFESLTVAQNVWIGQGPGVSGPSGSLDDVRATLGQVSRQYRLPIEPDRVVHDLSVGERQRVEILRALLAKPSLLILDEPTSVLTPQAVEALFATLRQLAAEGCSILYISHKLREIQALCHRATVLRAGRVVGTLDPSRETATSLARRMLGDAPPRVQRAPSNAGGASLVVDDLCIEKRHAFGVSLRNISFVLHGGEILGVAGVSGNGQQELLAALSGEDTLHAAGCIRLWDEDVTHAGPRARRRKGLRFVPDERVGRASVPSLSLMKNVLLTRPEFVSKAGLLRTGALRALTARLLASRDIKAGGPDALAGSLSGGNLQKFILERELDAAPEVFIVSQPTWGVDAGASAQIRSRLVALRDAGRAVLVVSEDLDELFEICDALVVIAGGRLSPRMQADDMSAERIGQWMSGLWPQEPAPRAESEGAPRAPA